MFIIHLQYVFSLEQLKDQPHLLTLIPLQHWLTGRDVAIVLFLLRLLYKVAH